MPILYTNYINSLKTEKEGYYEPSIGQSTDELNIDIYSYRNQQKEEGSNSDAELYISYLDQSEEYDLYLNEVRAGGKVSYISRFYLSIY